MANDSDHVLDMIDSTLSDFSVSLDAMRYAPEVAAERDAAPRPAAPLGIRAARMWSDHNPPGRRWGVDIGALAVTAQSVQSDHQPVQVLFIGYDPSSSHSPSVRALGTAVQNAAARLRTLGPALTRAAAALARLQEAVDPDPDTMDPRERALYLRQHRNTGPAKDPHRHRGSTRH